MNGLGTPEEPQASTPATPEIKKVGVEDLKPKLPELDGTAIVLQVNARDKRDVASLGDFGELLPNEAESTFTESEAFFNQLFKDATPEARGQISVLLVVSSSRFRTLNGKFGTSHMRAYDTGLKVVEGLNKAMSENGVNPNQFLNKTGKPMVITSRRLEDLKALEDSPEFAKILIDKYGTGTEFWEAFEDDFERDARIEKGVEGPKEIADRVRDYVGTVANAAKLWHGKHPDRRLIVWAIGHYDNLAPYIKENVTKVGTVGTFMKMDKRGGIVMTTGPDHEQAKTTIQGHEFDVQLVKNST